MNFSFGLFLWFGLPGPLLILAEAYVLLNYGSQPVLNLMKGVFLSSWAYTPPRSKNDIHRKILG